MSDKPEKPGQSLIPHASQARTGEHDHLLNGMRPYPHAMTRAYHMKLAVSLPPSTLDDSVFTAWDTDVTRANASALAQWLHDFYIQQSPLAKGQRAPGIVTDFYKSLSVMHLALGRVRKQNDDVVRNFFPAPFELPLTRLLADEQSNERGTHVIKSDLEQLKKALEKLVRFPAPANQSPENRRGVEEFRRLVRDRLIAQLDRALHTETVAQETLEDQLPQGESFEATTYHDKIEQQVGTWLDIVSKRPSSGRMRGE